MEEVLVRQDVAMRAVERALTNFKKMGKAKLTAAVVQQRIVQLKTSFAQCEQIHAKLLVAATKEAQETEEYFVNQRFLTCEENFYEALDHMADRYQWLTLPDAAETSSSPNSTFIGSRTTPPLPRISLPKFGGEFTEWETFRDHFRSVIVDNTELSDITRMHYLLSCLKGEALDSVKALPITEANYKVAWKIVTQRYENKRRLVHEHVHILHTLSHVTSESASELTALRDKASMAIQALKNLGRAVDSCDDFLVYLITQRLDRNTRKAWELHLGNTVEYPTYKILEEFLAARIRALENIPSTAVANRRGNNKPVIQSHSVNTVKCPVCRQDHAFSSCPEFRVKSVAQRRELVNKFRRCFNCLSGKHLRNDCRSQNTCRTCQKRHHSLLHVEVNSPPPEIGDASTSAIRPDELSEITSHLLSPSKLVNSGILLATAWIRASTPDGRHGIFRAMLDQGSAMTLVTERLAQRLRLKRQKISVSISGIGGAAVAANHAVQIHVAARDGRGPSFPASALVLKSLTTYMPPKARDFCTLNYLHGLTLADQDPSSSDSIDILIGADLYDSLLLNGFRRRSLNEPVAQNTVFGWILSGITSAESPTHSSVIATHHCCSNSELTTQLRQFWQTEKVPLRTHLTEEEQRCENHFLKTHTRDSSGRYIERLPFKGDPPIDLGESKSSALCLLRNTLKRLDKTESLATEYNAFLNEYARLNHMALVQSGVPPSSPVVYIPHHAVIRETSSTTRLRVVFNASHKTSNGLSLNDHLMVGPKLQQDIAAVLMRWRQYRYVYTADIEKMYRQIKIDEADTDYQRILWKGPTDDLVKEYRLLTVTYGTACAPYLALRVTSTRTRRRFPISSSEASFDRQSVRG